MIKCDEGSIRIDGSAVDVLTEFSLITHHLKMLLEKASDEKVAEGLIKEAVDLGLESEEEIARKAEIETEEAKMMDAIDRLALGAFKGGK